MVAIRQATIRKLVSLVLVAVFAMIFGMTADYFFTWRNITTMLREVSVIGLLSVGVTFVIIGGGIDLSTGAVLGLGAMIASKLVTETMIPVWLIIVLVLAVGFAAGFINGLLVVRFELPEFIATFATMFIYRGIVYLLAYRANGRLITRTITDRAYLSLGGHAGGIYYMSVVWLLVIVISYLVLKKTRFGTYVYAVGTSKKSSQFSGINVGRIKITTFVISSMCAALAGVFMLAWQGSAGLDTGYGMEFQAIAAVVVGGIVLSGGRGDTLGVAIGSIFMIMIVNGLYKYGLPTEVQTIVYGAVIIIMSVFDSVYIKLMEKRQVAVRKETAKGGTI